MHVKICKSTTSLDITIKNSTVSKGDDEPITTADPELRLVAVCYQCALLIYILTYLVPLLLHLLSGEQLVYY